MRLYIAQDGEPLGPYTDRQLCEYIAAGMLTPDEPACLEGQDDWRPLKHFLPSNFRGTISSLRWRDAPRRGETQEQFFLQSDYINVTNTRFVVGLQTYAMSSIVSVQLLTIAPRRTAPVLLLLAGLALAVFGLFASIKLIVYLGMAASVAALIWLFCQRRKFVALLRTSGGGEVRAVEHSDPAFVDVVIDALNRSIASRA